MSGGSLPKTGMGAITVGGVAGVGYYTVPIPVMIALTGAALVIVGAVLIRFTFRPGRSAARR